MVQVKIELDGPTHRVMKAKAALKGQDMKDYIVSVLDKAAAEPMEVPRRESDECGEEGQEGEKE